MLGIEPFPSLADLGYLSFIPLPLAGLLCFARTQDTPARRTQFWLDVAIVVVGVGAAVWYFLLYPIYRAEHNGLLELVLAEAYPVGDMVLLLGVVALVLKHRGEPAAGPFLLLAAGLACHFAADASFAYQALKGTYASGRIPDILYNLAYFLMMLGAWRAHRAAGRPVPARGAAAAARSSWMPYAAVALAYGLLLYVSRDDWDTPVGGLIVVATLLAALVATRQLLSARENARLRAAQAAQETEARYASLIRHSSDAVLLLGEDLRVRFASLAAQSVLGYAPEALTGRALLDLVHTKDLPCAARFLEGVLRHPGTSPAVEWRLYQEKGGWRYVETVASNLLADPRVNGVVLNCRDIGERRLLEAELEQAAFRDQLTGLANRALFRMRIERALERAAQTKREVAVLLVDLDDFKTVNDALGRDLGDALLRVVAMRLLRCAGSADTVARLGGDELAMLVEGPPALPDVVGMVQTIAARLAEPVALDEHRVPVHASVGIARGGAGMNAETLLHQAEVAMYAVKARGKNGYLVYEPGLQAAAMARMHLTRELHDALERDELVLYYQPIVRLPDRAFSGVEALVRWQHPRRGLLLPAAFVPLAEERVELIGALGQWVLRQACRQGAAWQAMLPPGTPLHLAVNVSARQLLHAHLAEEVAQALAETRLRPEALVLEITEGTLMQRAEGVMRQLADIKALGVRLAIDDFGTGYSALSYLHRFPVDVLKVDKSFVDCLREGQCDTRLAGAIIALASAFGMTTVAEGVESAMQAEALERLGCVLVQGFHFSRPVPREVIEGEWIAPLVAAARGDGAQVAP